MSTKADAEEILVLIKNMRNTLDVIETVLQRIEWRGDQHD